MVLRGGLSPTTANHDFKQQEERIYPEAVIVSTSALTPGVNAGAPVALSSRDRCETLMGFSGAWQRGGRWEADGHGTESRLTLI
jgi:hypothetical protein